MKIGSTRGLSAPPVDATCRMRGERGARAAPRIHSAEYLECRLRFAARNDDLDVIRREDADELVRRGLEPARVRFDAGDGPRPDHRLDRLIVPVLARRELRVFGAPFDEPALVDADRLEA